MHPVIVRIGAENQVEFSRRALVIALLKVNEPDLDSGLPGIRLRALEFLELPEGVVELVLADVKLSQTLSRPCVLRVDLQQPLIGLNSFLDLAFKFENQG